MNHKICESCGAEYSAYKSGTESEWNGFWVQIPEHRQCEVRGKCFICNPLSDFNLSDKYECHTMYCDGCDRLSIFTGEICNQTTGEQKKTHYNERNQVAYNLYQKTKLALEDKLI